ncbi:hypothetical protein LUW76_42930 [Actinomadura madurae]|uniref:hypothetical protein n=1 Tax=Actinomadura madurae TaxID=1993 RepID=UPI0020267834|nr:hypothetical protein [Actinomadura madurae]URN00521.1 hypothetical protein LUW76_42930 [Actinomadura madurae]
MSSASQLEKYAWQAARVTSWVPGTTTTRCASRPSRARRLVRNDSASANSLRLPEWVMLPVTTSRSGRGTPASASRVTSLQIRSCSSAAVVGSPGSARVRPNRGPDTCRTLSRSRGSSPAPAAGNAGAATGARRAGRSPDGSCRPGPDGSSAPSDGSRRPGSGSARPGAAEPPPGKPGPSRGRAWPARASRMRRISRPRASSGSSTPTRST